MSEVSDTLVAPPSAPSVGSDAPSVRSDAPSVRSVAPPSDVTPKAAEPITVSGIGRAWQALVDTVGDELDHRQRLWVLEAGAGARTLFDMPEDAYVVGVDRDPWALERNIRLDERILAELAHYRPLATGFDLLNCWYVLDRLEDPATMLDRFAQWTGEGGLVVLAVTNVRSPRGLLNRLVGPAKLRRHVTPTAVRRHLAGRGFTALLQVYFEDESQAEGRRRLRITRRRWSVLQVAVRVLSLGLLDAARTDYIGVFRRDR
jgi:hypothetical protein